MCKLRIFKYSSYTWFQQRTSLNAPKSSPSPDRSELTLHRAAESYRWYTASDGICRALATAPQRGWSGRFYWTQGTRVGLQQWQPLHPRSPGLAITVGCPCPCVTHCLSTEPRYPKLRNGSRSWIRCYFRMAVSITERPLYFGVTYGGTKDRNRLAPSYGKFWLSPSVSRLLTSKLARKPQWPLFVSRNYVIRYHHFL